MASGSGIGNFSRKRMVLVQGAGDSALSVSSVDFIASEFLMGTAGFFASRIQLRKSLIQFSKSGCSGFALTSANSIEIAVRVSPIAEAD